jgi:cellulose synthase/poly-beta-1,6-N-acetylglucosamine synthase-like glycosyltransferase
MKHLTKLKIFSSWLPAATAAPTPVSPSVHSSALVTAGVYLFIRFSPSFSYWLNVILLFASGLTMFIAGLGANFEFYLKRIIASSTVRQLGLMTWYISFWLFPRRLNINSRRFGTLCRFHLHPPVRMEPTECSETSAFNIQTPGKYPEESAFIFIFTPTHL